MKAIGLDWILRKDATSNGRNNVPGLQPTPIAGPAAVLTLLSVSGARAPQVHRWFARALWFCSQTRQATGDLAALRFGWRDAGRAAVGGKASQRVAASRAGCFHGDVDGAETRAQSVSHAGS